MLPAASTGWALPWAPPDEEEEEDEELEDEELYADDGGQDDAQPWSGATEERWRTTEFRGRARGAAPPVRLPVCLSVS